MNEILMEQPYKALVRVDDAGRVVANQQHKYSLIQPMVL